MTILFIFAVAYTWLAYLRDWKQYRVEQMKKHTKHISRLMQDIGTLVRNGEVPVLELRPGRASKAQVDSMIESIEEYARLLGGSVKVIIER